MLALNNEFVKEHQDTGVILSPRNCKRAQIEKHAKELNEKNARVLFDPQFYQPYTERENIINYPYWGEGLDFATIDFAKAGAEQLCDGVLRYQIDTLSVSSVILPGRYTNALSEEWLELQSVLAVASDKYNTDKDVYSTLALGPEIILERQLLDKLLNELVQYPVEGFYIVLKSPNTFLITNETYLYNLLDAILSLKLSGKKILFGYSNQQSLLLNAAGIDGVATGNFRNVRSFDPAIFDVPENNDIKQKATWYYDGNTLSEYRVETLTLAYQRGLKGKFGPESSYTSSLLKSTNPSNVIWGEKEAFRHYFSVINDQWMSLNKFRGLERVNHTIEFFERAQSLINSFIELGFRQGERSYVQAFEPTLNALYAFKADRKSEIELLND
jgi:hypothetical protein